MSASIKSTVKRKSTSEDPKFFDRKSTYKAFFWLDKIDVPPLDPLGEARMHKMNCLSCQQLHAPNDWQIDCAVSSANGSPLIDRAICQKIVSHPDGAKALDRANSIATASSDLVSVPFKVIPKCVKLGPFKAKGRTWLSSFGDHKSSSVEIREMNVYCPNFSSFFQRHLILVTGQPFYEMKTFPNPFAV